MVKVCECFMLYYVSSSSEVVCPLPELQSNIFYDAMYNSYQDILTLKCMPGFWFHANVTTMNITCSAKSTWEPLIENCICKH